MVTSEVSSDINVDNDVVIDQIKKLIDKRIKQLSRKSMHYVVDMGSAEEPKEEKVYHKAGKGRSWCSACERIKELKRLLNKI